MGRPNIVIAWIICYYYTRTNCRESKHHVKWWELFEIWVFLNMMKMNHFLRCHMFRDIYCFVKPFKSTSVVLKHVENAVWNLPKWLVKQFNRELPYDLEISLLYIPQRIENCYSNKWTCRHVRVQGNIINNSQKVERGEWRITA